MPRSFQLLPHELILTAFMPEGRGRKISRFYPPSLPPPSESSQVAVRGGEKVPGSGVLAFGMILVGKDIGSRFCILYLEKERCLSLWSNPSKKKTLRNWTIDSLSPLNPKHKTYKQELRGVPVSMSSRRNRLEGTWTHRIPCFLLSSSH